MYSPVDANLTLPHSRHGPQFYPQSVAEFVINVYVYYCSWFYINSAATIKGRLYSVGTEDAMSVINTRPIFIINGGRRTDLVATRRPRLDVLVCCRR